MTAIARDLAGARPPPGELLLWALGQAGFALRTDDALVLIDPWLSDWLETRSVANPNPVVRHARPPLRPDEIEAVDVVCVTHEHPDHLDGPTLAAIARRVPGATFVVPAPAAPLASRHGLPGGRIVPARAGGSIDLDGVRITALPCAHELHPDAFGGYRFWQDSAGDHRALGYCVQTCGRRVFHAGDTVWYPRLSDELRRLRPDLAILPMNGRDWMRERRGIVGNLTAPEVAALAADAQLAAVVPCHFDGVTGNTADPAELVREMAVRSPGTAVHVLHPGDQLRLPMDPSG